MSSLASKMMSKKQRDVPCDFCNQKHYDTSRYYSHANKHHLDIVERDWSKCDLCKMYFPTYDVVERHKAQSHSTKPKTAGARFNCAFCTKTYSLGSLVYRHCNITHADEVKSAGWLPCPVCEVYFPTQATMDLHKIQTHTSLKRQAQMVRCAYCPKSVGDKAEYYNHCNRWHSDSLTDWHTCADCGKKFPEFGILSNHRMRVHSRAQKKFKPLTTATITCTVCAKVQNSIEEHYFHVNKLHTETIETDWPKCNICNMHLPGLTDLEFHKFSEHSDSKIEGGSDPRTGKRFHKTPDRVKCSFCSSTCATRSIYYKHANIFHLDIVQAEWYGCDQCNTFFPSENVLKLHEKQMHLTLPANRALKRLECQFCNVLLSDKGEFYKHANRDHFDLLSEWHECKKCELRLPDDFSLKNHTYRVHSIKKRGRRRNKRIDVTVLCQFCASVLPTQEAYYRHANVSHAQEIDNEGWTSHCDICEVRLPGTDGALEKHNYVAHIKAEKAIAEKVQCNYCPNTFARHRLFINHANQYHWDEVALTWILCDICMVYFPTQEVLTKHKSISHKCELGAEMKKPNKPAFRPNSVACKFCPVKLSRNTAYYVHANDFHANELESNGWKKCDECGMFFPTNFALKNHLTHGHTLAQTKRRAASLRIHCNYCKETFNDADEYHRHSVEKHLDKISSTWIICRFCDLYYAPTLTSLLIHQNKYHPESEDMEDVPLSCDFCSDTFVQSNAYYVHANQKHSDEIKENWFPCDRCEMRVPDEDALDRHALTHSKGKESKERGASESSKRIKDEWISCEVCEIEFPTEKTLHNHQERMHAKKTRGPRKTRGKPKKSILPRKIDCDFCSRKFKRILGYYKHANSAHAEQVAEEWTPCDACSYFFPDTSALNKHMALVHPVEFEDVDGDLEEVTEDEEDEEDSRVGIESESNQNLIEEDLNDVDDDIEDVEEHIDFLVDVNKEEVTTANSTLGLCEICGTPHQNPEDCPRKESDNWVSCEECYLSFRDEEALAIHQQSDHAEQVIFQDEIKQEIHSSRPILVKNVPVMVRLDTSGKQLPDQNSETGSDSELTRKRKAAQSPSRPVLVKVPKTN